jgi:hypothetical protein
VTTNGLDKPKPNDLNLGVLSSHARSLALRSSGWSRFGRVGCVSLSAVDTPAMFHQRASPSVNVQQAFPAAKTRAHLNFQGRTDLRKLVVIEELRLRPL